MLSYQHAYHAGGPADVHKHALLRCVLLRLAAKAKPFTAIDLHGGEGWYALTRPEALKTAEYTAGIGQLWTKTQLGPDLAGYLAMVRSLNPGDTLSAYPGSPEIMRAVLRPADRLIVNELHPAASIALKRWAGHDNRVAVHRRDATEALLALVPPEIRRGVVMIDPSYEQADEYTCWADLLVEACRKWREGTYVVWYPILTFGRHAALLAAARSLQQPAFDSAFLLGRGGLLDAPDRGLRGSGVLVVNPPYPVEDAVERLGAELVTHLTGGTGAHTLTWLTERP
jgi:23S rRNA (adenine2030-N6)-methyltransferase